MTAAHAQSLLASEPAIIVPLDPAGDRRRLDALVQWSLRRFSPRVQADPFANTDGGQAGLLADITGCERLFHGEDRLLRLWLSSLARLGLACRGAVADTLGGAWAVAHFAAGPDVVVAPGQIRAAIEPLPAAALRLDETLVAALAEVGLRTVGQLLAVPADPLRQRFGPDVSHRIDQAIGRSWEPVAPTEHEAAPFVELMLGGPSRNIEAIMLGTRNLLTRLLAELARRSLGVCRLELRMERSDLGPLTLPVVLAHASADEKHLWALLRPVVENAQMGFGVEALRLTAARTAELKYVQPALLAGAGPQGAAPRMSRALGELVDVLVSRLGSGAVSFVHPIDSHLPERAFERTATMAGRRPMAGSPRMSRPRSRAAALRQRSDPANPAPPDRPSVLLDTPEPVTVTSVSPDGPVAALSWAGRLYRVLTCVGPERLSPQWWGRAAPPSSAGANDPRSARDYFKVQTAVEGGPEGLWLWLYRQQRDNRWFVHGIWQ